MNDCAAKGCKRPINQIRDAKNIFFLEKCSQKIPTDEMLPLKRKCPKCKGKIEQTGGSWNTVTYRHSGLQDTSCNYWDEIFKAPSCRLVCSLEHEREPWVPKIWGRESIRPENLLEHLDRDLREMEDLYSSREAKVLESAAVNTKKAPQKPKQEKKPAVPREESEEIERPGYPRHSPEDGKDYWSVFCPVCGEINEIEAVYDEVVDTISKKITRKGWVPKAGPMAKQCKHFSSRVLMRYNPDYYFRKKPGELTLLEKAEQKAEKLEAAKKAQPEPQKQKINPPPPDYGHYHPVPESRKRKRKPVYHNPNSRQEDLFKFFPQSQTSVDEWFEMERGGRL